MKPKAQQREVVALWGCGCLVRLWPWLRHLTSLNLSSFTCKMGMTIATFPPSWCGPGEPVNVNKNGNNKGAFLITRKKSWVKFLDYLKWDKDKYSVCFSYALLDAFFLRNQFIPVPGPHMSVHSLPWSPAQGIVHLQMESGWVLRGHCEGNHL